MTVCNFFLQGRCRYGDKCWNEHPKGERGGDYRGNQQPRGGGGGGGGRGGFGNRVWVNPSQRSGGNYIQPSTFSRDGSDWSKRDVKSSEFSFSSQNRFTALNPQNINDKGGQTSADDNTNHVDTIQNDMEAWQGSGQWPFSCYSILSVQISGFVELSPEELRLEYYTSRASGDLQPYVNSVQQLSNQWKSRVQELQTMNNSTQISVISELNNPQTSFGSSSGFKSASGFGSTTASGFGSTTASGFGSTTASGFGSTTASGFGSTTASGFGSTTASGFGSTTASGFGSTTASGFGSTTASGFGTGGFGSSSQSSNTFSFASDRQQAPGFSSAPSAQPPSGFGPAPQSAAAFSFAAPAADNKPSTGTSASGFSFKSSSSSSSAGGFGTGFSSLSAAGSGVGGDAGDRLFTAHSDLTAEELKEFRAKRFTLGQIPLKPPPADLLAV